MVMLAKKYKDQDPKGMWMSEKLDGVRCVWNGSEFISRTGKVFDAPEHYYKGMPSGIRLDGELWAGRGMFQKTVGRIRSHGDNWYKIKFMIFDIINDKPFEDRLKQLKGMSLSRHCKVVEQTICNGHMHLTEYESDILKAGGEGVILRTFGSYYEDTSPNRSSNLLKVKRFDSEEAEVIGYQDGEGKHQGRLGALICKYADKVFEIGTGLSDSIRELPPKIGSQVTFSFFGLTDGGKPRHASFLTCRDYE